LLNHFKTYGFSVVFIIYKYKPNISKLNEKTKEGLIRYINLTLLQKSILYDPMKRLPASNQVY